MNECIHCGESLPVGASSCSSCARSLSPDGSDRVVTGALLASFFLLPLVAAPAVLLRDGPTPGAISLLAVAVVVEIIAIMLIVRGRRQASAWTRAAHEARAARAQAAQTDATAATQGS